MKVFRYLTALVAGLMAFTACEKDPADLYAVEATAPVMDSHADILLTENSIEETLTFSWKAARGMGEEVMYTLYATYDSQEISLTSTNGLYFTAGKEAFRTQLLSGFGLDANNNFSIGMYVAADNGVTVVKSEPITMNVFVYGDYVPAIVAVDEAAAQGIVLSEGMTEDVTLISWTEARFEYGTNPLYKVEIVYNDGARQELASGLTTTKYSISPTTLNSTLIALGCPKDTACDVQLIVTSYLEGEGAPQLESPAVTVQVTTYTPSYPAFVQLCGDFGGHAWNTAGELPILKGDANTGVYHGVVSIYGQEWGFKVIYTNPKDESVVWLGGTATSEGEPYTFAISASAGNMMQVADGAGGKEGTFVFYLDLAAAQLTMAPVSSIGLIGSATELGWDGQTNFTYNPDTGAMELKGITLGEGAYKVRVNDNWGNPWEDPYAYNLGGDPNDMTFGGSDIPSEPGVYDITMNLSTSANYALTFNKTGDVVIEDPMAKNYGLVGTINNWGETPDLVFEAVEGKDYKVVKNVTLTESDQIKIRVDSDWAENYGGEGDVEPYALAVDTKVTLVAGGKNMSMAAGSYDFYFYPKTKEFIAVTAGAELPSSSYGLVGTINSWGGTPDLAFEPVEGSAYTAVKNVTVTAEDQFKVRFANAWDENYGGSGDTEPYALAAGEATTLVANGKNMSIAAGTYDFYFNAETKEFLALTAGSELPKPAVNYGLVGDLNGWGGTPDIAFTAKGNGEYILLGQALEAGKGFKIRANNEWNDAENYGGQVSGNVTIDALTTLVNGGGSQNMSVETTGTYDLYFYPAELKLYVMTPGKTPADAGEPVTPPAPSSEQIEVGLIGVGGNWDTDVMLAQQADGSYKVENVALKATDTFKVRKAGAWDDNFNWGLAAAGIVELGVEVELTCGGGSANMSVAADGTYNVYFYPTLDGTAVVKGGVAKIKIESVGGSTPSGPLGQQIEVGLVGSMTNWSSDVMLTKQADGSFLAENVALTAADEFKVRKAGAWDDNFNWGLATAGVLADGVETDLTVGGGAQNMKVAADGKYHVYFYPTTDEGGVIPAQPAKIKVVKQAEEPVTPTPSVLEWSSSLFEQFYNTLGGDNYTEDVDLGNGLKFIAGGSKCKFGSNSGAYRIQLGGSGSTSKCTLQLAVTGPGKLEVDIQSSGDAARYLAVAVDGTEVTPAEGLEAPDKTAERKVHTIDCSSAKAGSVINMYSKGSAINVFVVKWTPAQ